MRVFDVVDGEPQRGAGQVLKGCVLILHHILHAFNSPRTRFRRHTGPVWQVAWAHPKFGSILASCSYDGKALIWKEQQPGQGWAKIKEHTLHSASGAPIFPPPISSTRADGEMATQ